MSIQRIQDTRRIVGNSTKQIAPDGRGICTLEPYFEKGAASSYWIYFTGIVPPNAIYEQELVLVSNDNYFYQNANLIPGNIGFIITIKELSPGKQVVVAARDVQIKESMSQPGRYTGVLPNVGISFTLECAVYSAGIADGLAKITELFFFNADLYTYEDFLQSPNAILQCEQKNTRSEISIIYPRLGWSGIVPTELNTGRWLGNLLLYSEQAQQAAWVNAGLTITADAVAAPDGTTTADKLADKGTITQKGISTDIPAGDKCFSVWVRSVSGTVTFQINIVDPSGAVMSQQSYVASTSWTRFQVSGSTINMGYGAQIFLDNATGIYVWGMQQVLGTVPGAYTKTTTARLPVGTPPFAGALEQLDVPGSILGDRLENTVWDGSFSTPIAWVCVASGSPGTWKAVYLFDAKNSNKDPYLFSYSGSSSWASITSAPQVTFGNGSLIVVNIPITSSVELRGLAECCVVYELCTMETNIPSASGYFFFSHIWLAPGGDGNGQRVGIDGTGVISKDFTIASPVTFPKLSFWQFYNQSALGSFVCKKLLVRPKYPLLTKAPSSFAAAPTALTRNNISALTTLTDKWYSESLYPYAAGVITCVSNQPLWQKILGLVTGKTYRVRMNVVTFNGDFAIVPCDSTGNGLGSNILFPTGTGIKELTFVMPAGAYGVFIITSSTGSQIDYVRLYSE